MPPRTGKGYAMSDPFEIRIRKVEESSSFKDRGGHPQGKGKRSKEREDRGTPQNYFRELISLAERAHKVLEQKKSPFRFRVYRENDEIFIDIVILDESGSSDRVIKKKITHQEFSDIIKNLETLDGIIVDYTA